MQVTVEDFLDWFYEDSFPGTATPNRTAVLLENEPDAFEDELVILGQPSPQSVLAQRLGGTNLEIGKRLLLAERDIKAKGGYAECSRGGGGAALQGVAVAVAWSGDECRFGACSAGCAPTKTPSRNARCALHDYEQHMYMYVQLLVRGSTTSCREENFTRDRARLYSFIAVHVKPLVRALGQVAQGGQAHR